MDVCDVSVVKVNLENLKLWKSIFRSIKSVVDGGPVSLCIHKAGYVTVKTHDSAHVALLIFKMSCDVEGLEDDDISLVLNSAKLDLKLNMPKEQHDVALVYCPNAPIDKNLFLFEEESEGCASFNTYRLNLLNDDTEEPGLPPNNETFLFSIVLEMSLLRGVLSNANTLKGETISFIISQSKSKTSPTSDVVNRLRIVVGIGSDDEFEKCFTTLHENSQDAKRIELDGPALRGAQPVAEAPFVVKLDATYSVKQLLDFLGALEPQTICIGLSKNMPLKLTYPLDETGESFIHFYAAPRIRDDDE
tara:strand:- start:3662 stop:4573 length:912 start_codon:yes stop_codon:yes gene_type:complete